jgi:hypothetical protein
MDHVRLTPENAKQYVGYDIRFKTRGHNIVKKILGVSATGKTVDIDHPDLRNNLEIVSRKVFVLLDNKT